MPLSSLINERSLLVVIVAGAADVVPPRLADDLVVAAVVLVFDVDEQFYIINIMICSSL